MLGFILINVFELLAFAAAFFYYRKHPSKPNFYLLWFLGITCVFEIVNWYTALILMGHLQFLADTPFESNYWLGNIYALVSYLFYIQYFKWFLTSHRYRHAINIVSAIFLLFGVMEIIISGGFFNRFMPLTNILGTLLVFLSIGFYYLKLLKSDHILLVHRSLPFYISVGALMFHLCTTPLFIYSSYYSNSIDPGFVSMYRWIIFGANYLLYSIYTVGFIVCYQTKALYYPNKNF